MLRVRGSDSQRSRGAVGTGLARTRKAIRIPLTERGTGMTKSKLIETVAQATDQPKRLVAQTIELTFEQIARAIREDKRFWMPGFGTFSVRRRQARQGFNP